MSDAPVRNHMSEESVYQTMDAGIRFAVRVLHAAGIGDTCQSCQGGEGHSYDRPSIDLGAGGSDALGFAALAALHAYGIDVRDVSIVWSIQNGLPYEKLWRITLWKSYPERADEQPVFVASYVASGPTLLRPADIHRPAEGR